MTRAAPADEAEARLHALLAGTWLTQTCAAVTGRAAGDVAAGLAAEAADPGSTVAGELGRRGVEPYVYSDGLEAFYRDSDAFLFELAVWNRRGFKTSMRRWTGRRAAAEALRLGRPLEVLAFGDGIGVDAASLAITGQRVVYFEVPGLSQRVAAELFDETGVAVEVVTDSADLAGRAFDAITCFDVLEHVPDPRALLADLVNRLRPGGLLFVHAPFYLILPPYPTHLAANRRYAGRLHWYERAGLTLIDGQPLWNPLLFRKGGDEAKASAARRAMVRATGLALQVGRYTSAPFKPFHRLGRVG